MTACEDKHPRNNTSYSTLQQETNTGPWSKRYEQRKEEDRLKTEEINRLLNETDLTKVYSCGFWIFKGPFFQRFANQTAYVVLFGIVSCTFAMTYAYFNGTITTLEKRFKIPSKNTGIIAVGSDISQMILSAVLSYYGGKGHRPRWIGFGLVTVVIFCLMNAAPHFIYGPGDDALALTLEYGGNVTTDQNKGICRSARESPDCEISEGNLAPQVILFVSQLISGIGGSLFYTLGTAYMDDNTKKSRTPALLSLSYFLRMLGPAVGYALASLCLRIYISPELKPTITSKDQRWLGAWWLGWLAIAAIVSFFGIFLTMFPKELPRAVARREVEARRRNKRLALNDNNLLPESKPASALEEQCVMEHKASIVDMLKTFRRLLSNDTFMYNNLSSVFYFFGYTPFWIFTPKYIEIQYKQSAATSSMVTGTVALAFSAVGILLAGFVISRYKPRARYLAAWNVIVGLITVLGMLTYSMIGCPGNEGSVVVDFYDNSSGNNVVTCNSNCSCDYVRYSPVCGQNNMTYISACHAGCKYERSSTDGNMNIYYECACVPSTSLNLKKSKKLQFWQLITRHPDGDLEHKSQMESKGGVATMGACPVDCWAHFVTFLCVMCVLKLAGASGRASNFLVGVRCVPEFDKSAAMGFGMMLCAMLAFIPSPIFFGWVLDRQCLVWGRTCTGKGNCWLYDAQSLRYTINIIAAGFIAVGTLFDVGVWYHVKELKIFDEDVRDNELEMVVHEV